MSWYDTFSAFYDHTVEQLYQDYREEAVGALALTAGARVLDLACGTGPNLPYLSPLVGDAGRVYAVDYSEGMLARARARVVKNGLDNVVCLERDARELCSNDLDDHAVDAIIVCLGLSVIPDWEAVLESVWSQLRPGGRVVVFDIFAERWVPQASVVTWMAQADLHRETWIALAALGAEVEHRFLKGSPHVHGGRPYLAVAVKPGETAALPS